MKLLVAIALIGGVAAGPATCWKGCDDNGGIPSGDYLDNACEVETCATTDTACLSVYSTSTSHVKSINPVTGNMDTTRTATSGLTGRVVGLGCVDAAKKAALKLKWDQIYTGTGSATCDDTAGAGSGTDHDACAAVTGVDLNTASKCEAVLTSVTTDAATTKACTYTAPTAYTFQEESVANENLCQVDDTVTVPVGAAAGTGTAAKTCQYGSFGNDWKLCGDVYCMDPNGNVKCMDIEFKGQWGGTWKSGMGCKADTSAVDATCDDWRYHKKFVEGSCNSFDPCVAGTTVAGGACAANMCVSAGMHASPSVIGTGLIAIALTMASFLTMA